MTRLRLNINAVLGSCILILWLRPIYSSGIASSGWQLSLRYGWPWIFPILVAVFVGAALLRRLWFQTAAIVLTALAADVVFTLTDGERYLDSAAGLLILLTLLCALMSTLHAVLHRLLPRAVVAGEGKSLVPLAALVISGLVLAPVYMSLSAQSRYRNSMYVETAQLLHLPAVQPTRRTPAAPIQRAAPLARNGASTTLPHDQGTDVVLSPNARQCTLSPVVENKQSLQAPSSIGLRRFDWLVPANELAVVTGAGELYLTHDDGNSWLHGRCGTLFRFDVVRFLTATSAWALGRVTTGSVDRVGIARTHDGGSTWDVRTIIPRQFYAARPWVDLHLWDAQHGIAIGAYEVLTTADGGETWHRAVLDVHGTIAAAGFGPQGSTWLYESNGQRSLVHRSLDRGTTWRATPATDVDPLTQQVGSSKSAAVPPFYQLKFESPTFGVALTPDARLLVTRDGGDTWQQIEPSVQGAGARITAMTLTGRQSAMVIVASRKDAGLYSTEDAGDSWQWISEIGNRNDLIQLEFADTGRGWRLGTGGTLERTTDAGLHWMPVGPFN